MGTSANMSELDALIDEFSRAAFHGNAAWFVGAGISSGSKLAGWVDLLSPLGGRLGITVKRNDDLPAIAQYFINKLSGNRGPLVQHLQQSLGRDVKPSFYHHQIARSNVGTVWTTNYDHLVESAATLAGLRHRVRVRESDMVGLSEPGSLDIVKAHGSFGVSAPEEFVIATADYEDYAVNRPATASRLRSDLLSKSFLFVGYGYGDPNIRAVLLEARRLSARAGHPHYMLTAAEKNSDPEAVARQALWKDDLARIGIMCVIMPDYGAIEDAVSRIVLRSRGPTIYVTGSHTGSNSLAGEIGAKLADPAYRPTILFDGQSTGLSREVLSKFQTECVSRRIDLNERLRFFSNPYASDPRLSSDPTLIPLLKEWRGSMLRQAHSVLIFDGGMGTRAETDLSRELGCCIVPVPTTANGSAMALLDDLQIATDLDGRAPGYVAKARALALTAGDVIDCLLADMPPWPY